MSNSLDIEDDLGEKVEADAAAVGAASEAQETVKDIDPFIRFSSDLLLDYNALKTGSTYRKMILGTPKDPVPARISVLDLAADKYVATSTSFLLLTVQRDRREVVQMVRGFDEKFLITSFGRDIPVYNISGALLNLKGPQDWVSMMNDFYENYLRASKLIEHNYQAVLHYSNRWMRGYMLSFSETDRSDNNLYLGFGMSMAIRRDRVVGAREGQI